MESHANSKSKEGLASLPRGLQNLMRISAEQEDDIIKDADDEYGAASEMSSSALDDAGSSLYGGGEKSASAGRAKSQKARSFIKSEYNNSEREADRLHQETESMTPSFKHPIDKPQAKKHVVTSLKIPLLDAPDPNEEVDELSNKENSQATDANELQFDKIDLSQLPTSVIQLQIHRLTQ